MNKKIYEHLKEHCRKEKCDFEESDILEILREEDEVYIEKYDPRIMSDEVFEFFRVVKVDGMLIGYNDAVANTAGQLTAHECGWDFDPESCCEVERHEETKVVVSYKLIK